MKVLRVCIKGWTASYRFPPFVMAQPTLPVPPLSTCYGILSAAMGKLATPKDTSIGLVAPFKATARDLEKIYQVNAEGKIEQKNIIDREFIYETELYLYLSNTLLRQYFREPRYPILLGRSYDLAYVKEAKVIDLADTSESNYQFTLLPFPLKGVAAPISALPVYFTEDIPRRPAIVKPFYVISKETVTLRGEGLQTDVEKGWGVFMHEYIR